METSTVISIISLIVSFLAFPVSYLTAMHQVKKGLDEAECRSKQKARILVANSIDEFYKIFYSAVREIVHIEPNELQSRLKEIDPYLSEIDTFIIKTKIFERLIFAIDNLLEINFADLPSDGDAVRCLQSIRGQILLGSNSTRNVTCGVISICKDIDLQTVLRKT